MSYDKELFGVYSEEIDFGYMPSHLADEIYLVAVECVKDALASYGHNDERAWKDSDEVVQCFFLGLHGLHCSWLAEPHKADKFDIVSAIENQEIAERIAEGAEMEGLTMVDWMVRAITKQFVRDSIAKGERDGDLIWNGEYRNREPVFVSAEIFRKMAN